MATFTATDPEMAGAITWSLATGDDADDFDDRQGRRRAQLCEESPDYEMATGGGAAGTSNTYTVTVIATDYDGHDE